MTPVILTLRLTVQPMTLIHMAPTLTGHTEAAFMGRRSIPGRPCNSGLAFAANATGIIMVIVAMFTVATAAVATVVGMDAVADVEAAQ